MSATAALFVLLFATGCLLALARHPIFGVMTYVLLFYVSPSDRWWGQGVTHGVRWALIAALVTILAIVIHRPQQPAIPLLRQPLMWGYIVFVAWVALQGFWVITPELHGDLLIYYLKYIVAMYLIYRSLDSELNLKRFIWAHVLGCTYIAWIAFTQQDGGRFDDFGGSGIGDANSGALTIVTGVLAAASLFLAGSNRTKLAVVAMMPVLVNADRRDDQPQWLSGVRHRGTGFQFVCTEALFKLVRILSVLGLVLFLMLTNPVYWARIQSLEYRGEQVEGVDTGAKRLVLVQAQLKMFQAHPFGCGSRCTDALSPDYLDAKQLAGTSGHKSRSSHNTFMTMLVDHGMPGAVAYLLMVAWVVRSLATLRRECRDRDDFLAQLLPAVAGGLIAIIVGDMFVQYPKLEIRFWMLTIVMSMLSMVSAQRVRAPGGCRRYRRRLAMEPLRDRPS